MAKKEKNAKRNIVFIFELSVIIAFFLFLLTGGLNGIGKQLGAFFNSQQWINQCLTTIIKIITY